MRLLDLLQVTLCSFVVRNEKVFFSLRWINAEWLCSERKLNMMQHKERKWPETYLYVSTRYMSYDTLSLSLYLAADFVPLQRKFPVLFLV